MAERFAVFPGKFAFYAPVKLNIQTVGKRFQQRGGFRILPGGKPEQKCPVRFPFAAFLVVQRAPPL